ncbi:unnamed protein product [Blepharisma stoltei]|uniref:Uncharacterized protein n=1 Tax=Blepharisma stoltei TaxID=1481888 RepID=A0AAU9KJ01_9CILI|nr:unnamed protein product [Blepharisma stoltei]
MVTREEATRILTTHKAELENIKEKIHQSLSQCQNYDRKALEPRLTKIKERIVSIDLFLKNLPDKIHENEIKKLKGNNIINWVLKWIAEKKIFENDSKTLSDLLNDNIRKLYSLENKLNELINKSKPTNFEEIKIEIWKEIEDISDSLHSAFQSPGRLKYLIFWNDVVRQIYEYFLGKGREILELFYSFIEKFTVEKNFFYNIASQKRTPMLVVKWIENPRTIEKYLGPIYLDSGSCMLELPDSELFLYGSSHPVTGNCCIINMKNYQIKKILPPGTPSFYGGVAYYKNSVYVFGGRFPRKLTHYSYESNCARRFDLIKNLWFQLPPMPEGNSLSSCITFKDSILFSGKGNTEIIKYDLIIESYSKISIIQSASNGSKLFLTDSQRIWVIESIGRIIESEIENEYVWKIIGSSKYSAYQNYFVAFISQVFYISLLTSSESFKYYKFDINQKTKEFIEDIGIFERKIFLHE